MNHAVIDELYFERHEIQKLPGLLQSLYYRARIRSTIVDVFTRLVDRKHILPLGLLVPVDIHKLDPVAYKVSRLLLCFGHLEQTKQDMRRASDNDQIAMFVGEVEDYAAYWLAVMITRSCCSSLEAVVRDIHNMRYLGPLNLESRRRYEEVHSAINFSPNLEIGKGTPDSASGIFEWILPSGLHLKRRTAPNGDLLPDAGPYT